MANICTDFVRRILQYVKVPDGIRAGDFDLFRRLMDLRSLIPDQLRTDIVNFDLDAFIMAAVKRCYHTGFNTITPPVVVTFDIWIRTLTVVGLENTEALDRCKKSFQSRIQKYQSDWRLQLLLVLAVIDCFFRSTDDDCCRCLDILLEMDDHNLHLYDQDALDLRHEGLLQLTKFPLLNDIISFYVDGDGYASVALQCMRFLSNPPKYSENNDGPNMGLIFSELEKTSALALDLLCKLLGEANTSLELVQCLIHHDINPEVRNIFPILVVWQVLRF